MAQSAAVTRRVQAINELVGRYVTAEHVTIATLDDRDDMIARLEQMMDLGRTDRWKGALRGWIGTLQDQTDDKGIRWCLFQYAVYACHAAE